MATESSGGGELAQKLPRANSGFEDLPTLEEALDLSGVTPSIATQVAVDENDPMIGRTLGFYTLVERLGEGAMGAVYRATSNRGEDYALKVLTKDAVLAQERFTREAKALLTMNHPQVVGLKDYGATEDGITFLVLELATGQTLSSVLQKHRPLGEQEMIEISAQIASSLEAAHRAGFVHRDLKPSNVMAEHKDGRWQVKLLDFGLAGLREPKHDSERLTDDGVLVGTPLYMAPEQIRTRDVDPRSDLYALGVIMYEMIAGQPPFEGDLLDVINGHCNNPPPPVAKDGPIVELMYELLSKNMDDRPSIEDTKSRLAIVRNRGLNLPTAQKAEATDSDEATYRGLYLAAIVLAIIAAAAVLYVFSTS